MLQEQAWRPVPATGCVWLIPSIGHPPAHTCVEHTLPRALHLALAGNVRARGGTNTRPLTLYPAPPGVREFLKPRFDIKKAGKACSNGHILKVFVEKSKKALDAAGTRTLVLFSPPDVRHKLVSMYKQAGIRPVVYDKKDLRKEFSHV